MSGTIQRRARALAYESGIECSDDTLFVVCRQAILDGEGTPERVREIWAQAEEDREHDAEWHVAALVQRGPQARAAS